MEIKPCFQLYGYMYDANFPMILGETGKCEDKQIINPL